MTKTHQHFHVRERRQYVRLERRGVERSRRFNDRYLEGRAERLADEVDLRQPAIATRGEQDDRQQQQATHAVLTAEVVEQDVFFGYSEAIQHLDDRGVHHRRRK